MADRSRDLSLERDGRTRLPPANPRAEAAQDLRLPHVRSSLS